MRCRSLRRVALCASLLPVLIGVPQDARGQADGLAEDPLASALLGTWTGTGMYEGAQLSLTRAWTLELSDQFLRSDMGVVMANGASFRSLAYWRLAEDGSYHVAWMDALGRSLSLRAVSDPASGEVSMNFVDDFTGAGPAWRRWIFKIIDEDAYVERLFGETPDGWKQLAEFSFRRDAKN